MKYSHSFHSLEAKKGPISFTFGHTHTGMVDTRSLPPPDAHSLHGFRCAITIALVQSSVTPTLFPMGYI